MPETNATDAVLPTIQEDGVPTGPFGLLYATRDAAVKQANAAPALTIGTLVTPETSERVAELENECSRLRAEVARLEGMVFDLKRNS